LEQLTQRLLTRLFNKSSDRAFGWADEIGNLPTGFTLRVQLRNDLMVFLCDTAILPSTVRRWLIGTARAVCRFERVLHVVQY